MSMCVHMHMLTYTGRNGGRERERENLRIYYLQKKNELIEKNLDGYILEIFSQ